MAPQPHPRLSLRKLSVALGVTALALALAACSQSAAPAPAGQPPAGQPAPAAQPTAAKAAQPAAAPSAAPAAPAVKKGGTLTVSMSAEPATLDEHVDTATQPASIRDPLYDTLVRLTDKGEIEPALATSWQASEDAKTWTFKLRQGVKFHDGTPFNAQAVKADFERLLDPGRPQTAAKNVQAHIQKVEVVDDATVRFTTAQPFAPMLFHLATSSGRILSPTATQKSGADYGLHPVGTGPFKFVEWVKGDHLTYERNPDYWDQSKINLDKIIFRFVKDASTRVAQLESGETDVAEVLPPTDIERLATSKDVTLLRKEGTRSYFYWMNSSKPPFDNKLVRQALNYGVDKQTIMNTVMKGIATGPSSNHLTPLTAFFVKGKVYEYDPEKAKSLLKEAGYPNGFETGLWTPGGIYPRDKEVAQAVADQLAKIGVKVNLKVYGDLTSYLDSPRSNDMDMAFISFASGAIDPNYMLTQTILSSNAGTPFNFSRIKDPKLDELLIKGRSTTKDSERLAAYTEIQKIMDDQAYNLLIAYLTNVTGLRKNVQGIQMLGNEYLIVRYASKS